MPYHPDHPHKHHTTIKIRKSTLTGYTPLSLDSMQMPPVALVMCFVTKGFSSESRVAFSCHGLLASTICDISLVLLDLHDLNTFEENRPVILQVVPQFGFVWCFLGDGFRLCIIGRIVMLVLTVFCQVVDNFDLPHCWWYNNLGAWCSTPSLLSIPHAKQKRTLHMWLYYALLHWDMVGEGCMILGHILYSSV